MHVTESMRYTDRSTRQCPYFTSCYNGKQRSVCIQSLL